MAYSSHPSDGNQPKRFLQPCLLLLIAECPGHGYDLLDRLAAFGFARDPGGLYRTLRSLEREELVRSEWQLSLAGPGRRRYELTPVGHARLRSAAVALEEMSQLVDLYLERYRLVEHEASVAPVRAGS